MTDVTKRAVATWVGTVALACAVIQPASAADIPVTPQYYGGPVEQEPVYQEPPPSYRHDYVAPRVYYAPAPAPVVVVPEPYYVPPRVYVGPGYRPYGYGPYVRGGYGHYVARGYGYHGGWHGGHRRW
jgi:hypothetical protein